jgi:hypothetical protein
VKKRKEWTDKERWRDDKGEHRKRKGVKKEEERL